MAPSVPTVKSSSSKRLTEEPKVKEDKPDSKYDVLTRPSRKLVSVSRALHEAGERLGIFRG